jgi:TolC family type I secretion outer membrane protein
MKARLGWPWRGTGALAVAALAWMLAGMAVVVGGADATVVAPEAALAAEERQSGVVELVPPGGTTAAAGVHPAGTARPKGTASDLSGTVVISGNLTVADAIRIALTHNPQLQSIRQGRERTRGVAGEAFAGFLPDLNLSGSYFRRVDVPRGPTGPLGLPDNWTFGATFTQPLYLGGAVINAYRAARVGQQVAEEQIRRVTQEVVFQVRKSYYDILVAVEFLAADRERRDRAQAFLSDVEKRFGQGVASNFDVLRARVELANAEASLIRSQNSLHLNQTSFLRVLGASQESDVVLVDRLVHEPLQPAVEEAMRQALLNRPEVLSSKLTVKAQTYQVEGTKAGLLPKVLLVGNYLLGNPPVSGAGGPWDDEFQGILSFEVPLFEGGATAARLVQQRALLEQFRVAVRDAEEQVLLDVTQAFLTLEDAEEFVRSQSVNLQQAEEGLRLAEAGYREGVTKQVEVLDARSALADARKNFSQAVYSHMLARLALERATGALAGAGGSEEGAP